MIARPTPPKRGALPSAPPASLQDALGIIWQQRAGAPLADHVSIGLRRNPRRAHLFVSHLLGKHIPVVPSTLMATVAHLCEGRAPLPEKTVVLGYAETATSLGFLVAREVGRPYLASTRYPQASIYGAFEEAHSHATTHVLTPQDPSLLEEAEAVVLVDDELTTGNTVLATIKALEERAHHSRYVVVTLLDGRSPLWQEAFPRTAEKLGITLEVWAHSSVEVHLPGSILQKAQLIAPAYCDLSKEAPPPSPPQELTHLLVEHDDRIATGLLPQEIPALEKLAKELRALTPKKGRLLVLGSEEFMTLPLLLARELERDNPLVRSSTTTLSPVLVTDQEGYPLRNGVSTTIVGIPRYAYNVKGFDQMVLLAPSYLAYRPFAHRLAQEAPLTFIEITPPLKGSIHA